MAAQPLRKPDPDTRSYTERIRELVEQDRVQGARRLLAEALEQGAEEHEPELLKWQRVLGPAKFLGFSSELEPDRTPEFTWLREHAKDYSGQWVILAADQLLAHSVDLKEALAVIKNLKTSRRPLLHYID
jgi:hypothetical protein